MDEEDGILEGQYTERRRCDFCATPQLTTLSSSMQPCGHVFCHVCVLSQASLCKCPACFEEVDSIVAWRPQRRPRFSPERAARRVAWLRRTARGSGHTCLVVSHNSEVCTELARSGCCDHAVVASTSRAERARALSALDADHTAAVVVATTLRGLRSGLPLSRVGIVVLWDRDMTVPGRVYREVRARMLNLALCRDRVKIFGRGAKPSGE